jgi:hypothetical protein
VTAAGIGPIDAPVALAVVMTIAAALYAGFFPRWWRALWRRPSPVLLEPFPWWVWGQALWRGYVRTLCFGGAAFAVMLVLVVLVIYGAGGRPGLVVTGLLLVATIAAGGLGMTTIVLFNRPRSLVPPYLRSQPGAVAEWLGAWRRRRDPAGGASR